MLRLMIMMILTLTILVQRKRQRVRGRTRKPSYADRDRERWPSGSRVFACWPRSQFIYFRPKHDEKQRLARNEVDPEISNALLKARRQATAFHQATAYLAPLSLHHAAKIILGAYQGQGEQESKWL